MTMAQAAAINITRSCVYLVFSWVGADSISEAALVRLSTMAIKLPKNLSAMLRATLLTTRDPIWPIFPRKLASTA